MVISLATVRASSARSRQYFGSLIGTLAMGLLLEPIMATIALDHGDDRALGGFQLFANQAAGHLDCRHHVAEIMSAADQRVADLDDSLGFGAESCWGSWATPQQELARKAIRVPNSSAPSTAVR